MLILMVRVASWVVGEMRKDRLLEITVIIVRRILAWVILHAVALMVVKKLCTSSRIWWDAVVVWMVVSC